MKKHEEAYLSLRREARNKLAGSVLCLGSGVVTPIFLPLGIYLAWRAFKAFGVCIYWERNYQTPTKT